MNKFRLAAAAAAAVLVVFAFSACAKKSEGTVQGGKLYIFNWTYYTPDSVIEKFEKEFGIDVVYDSFASNEEMFAKLKAGGSGYDIVFPSGDYVSIMKAEGMLEKIDRSKLKNLGNIDPVVLQKATYDPAMDYSVPYYFGASGIAVNKAKVPSYEKSWSIFSRTDLKGKMTMLDDMREVMGDALVHLGHSVNTVDPAQVEAAKKLINEKWKPNLIKKKDVDFFIPAEGGPSYIDSMCVLKGSKNMDAALKFIDFIYRPEIYAEFVDSFGFPSTANVPARALQKVTPYYPAEALVNTELKEDLGANLELYNKAWQDIRVGE